jgi:hypothetical protein
VYAEEPDAADGECEGWPGGPAKRRRVEPGTHLRSGKNDEHDEVELHLRVRGAKGRERDVDGARAARRGGSLRVHGALGAARGPAGERGAGAGAGRGERSTEGAASVTGGGAAGGRPELSQTMPLEALPLLVAVGG